MAFPPALSLPQLVPTSSRFALVPAAVAQAASDLSRWCLVTAIAALGIKTSLQKLAVVGWRPVALMVGETLFLALLVLAAVLLTR